MRGTQAYSIRNGLKATLESPPARMTVWPSLLLRMVPLRHLVLLALILPATTAATEEEDWFSVHEGHLSANIQKLIQSYGWTMEWKSDEDRIISQPFSVQSESLTDGLNNLLSMYEGKFVADLYNGNKVVRITPSPHNVEVMLPPADQLGTIRPIVIPPKIFEKAEKIRNIPSPAPESDAEDDAPPPPPQADAPPPVDAKPEPAAPPEWVEVAPEEEVDYTGSEVYDVTPIDKSGLDDPHSQLPAEMIPAQVAMPGSMPDAVFQVASMQEKAKAEKTVSRLLELGYDVRLSEYWRGDQSWFRVRVHVDANEDADKVKEDLEAHGYPVWVLLPGFSSRD